MELKDLEGRDAKWLLDQIEQARITGTMSKLHSLLDEYRYAKLPHTYEECCEYIGLSQLDHPTAFGYKAIEIEAFQQLLVCREAYKKFSETLIKPFTIMGSLCCSNDGKVYVREHSRSESYLFSFPVEITNLFLFNFTHLIDQCKEFI